MFVGRSLAPRVRHALAFCGLAIALATPAAGQPRPPVRLSVATDGTQANGESRLLAITPDGRTVLFASRANNLVAGDTDNPARFDLFIRDRDTDRDGILDEPGAVRTLRINEGLAGQQSDEDTIYARLSDDGRFVVFQASAGLVPEDTNGLADVYLRDRDTDGDGIFDEPGAVSLGRVSVGLGGAQGNGDSVLADMTPDVRYVFFWSAATNLAGTIPPGQYYRWDRLTDTLILASSRPDGSPSDGLASSAALSPDGRYAAFAGGFPEITGGATATPWVIRDLVANTLTPIASPSAAPQQLPAKTGADRVAAPATQFSVGIYPGFSPDGRSLYLVDTLTLILFSDVTTTGSISEYDVASGRIVRRFSGVPPLSYGPRIDNARVDFQGHLTLLFAPSASIGIGACEARGLSRYDQATKRVTSIANDVVEAGAGTNARRVVYSSGPCAGPLTTYLLDADYGVPLPLPSPVLPGTMDAGGTMVVYTSADATILGAADTNGVSDVFAVDLLSRLDRDSDGLDDRWEIAMGLDYTSSAGNDGAAGDPDGDGLTNLQEQTAHSHPRGAARQFLAEGAENAFFKTRIALANPGATAATAVLRFDGDNGGSTTANIHVPAGAKRTVFMDEVGGPSASFSTSVESSVSIVSERTMSWDATEYGAHAERASDAPSTHWFLAEGATGAFSLFYLLQNPGDVAATATIRYLRPAPLPPIDRSYTLPPHSRTTLPIEQQAPELASTDVSAAITTTQPILVERAMYRSVAGQPFAAGHDSAGVTSDATSWFLAEGATGPFFDMFILLANPNPTDAVVEIRYLVSGGTVLTKTYTVAAQSRRTIYVDGEDFPGQGHALDNVAVSCAITSTNAVPIVVERSMWFPGPEVTPNFWTEAHNSPGATATAHRWVLADGEAGGTKATQTYVLIANTSPTAGRARLTILPDLPTTLATPAAPITVTVDLPPNSRTTVPLQATNGVFDRRFGVLVESIDTTPLADLVVERAMYWNSGGETWAAGTNLLATPLP